jgi:hypothetical protein
MTLRRPALPSDLASDRSSIIDSIAVASWREAHGKSGGETNLDDEVIAIADTVVVRPDPASQSG